MVGHDVLIARLEGISEEDIRAARWNSAVREKLDGSRLEYIIFSLVSLLEMDSEESRQREKEKLTYVASLPNPSESSEHNFMIIERYLHPSSVNPSSLTPLSRQLPRLNILH